MDEVERIRQYYARREQQGKGALYEYSQPAEILEFQQRERALLGYLRRFGMMPLHDRRVLDVGCGSGAVLRRFIDYGVFPDNLYGIDLLEQKAAEAQQLQPNINVTWGSAEQLPYQDAFFDIVLQFMAFTSILDAAMKRRVAQEMLRVLKSGGIIVWHDFFVGKPGNSNVRGVGRGEIRQLFPDCRVSLRRVTLAAPLSRIVAPRSAPLAYLLQGIPLLCTHYLGVIQPTPSGR